MSIWFNNIKTAFLLGAMTALFVLVGSRWGTGGMILAFAFGGMMNIGAWWFSDKLALAAMRGREVDAQSAPALYAMIDRLRQRAGLPMPRVYICPHAAPNAFATGRNPKHAAVAVTEGALKLLNEHELEGVLAHELTHVRHRDTLISCVAATIAGVLAWIAQWGLLFGGGNREAGNPLVGILTIILAAVGAAVIKAMVSRSREFAADAGAAQIAGHTDGLISALQKLEATSKRIPLKQPNPAMNNMFIIEPMMGMRTLANIFASHPPTEKRIQALRAIEAEHQLG